MPADQSEHLLLLEPETVYLPTFVLFQACQKNHRAIDFPKAYAGNSVQLCLNLLSPLSHDAELDSRSNWFCFISFHVGVALPPSFILGLMGMVDSRHQYTDDVLALNNWYILWPLGWLLPQALSPAHITALLLVLRSHLHFVQYIQDGLQYYFRSTVTMCLCLQ